MSSIDVHQHLWTAALVRRLAVRNALPLVRRSRGLTVLHSAGEQPFVIDERREDPGIRAALVRAAGIERALVALSSPIGIEALPRDSALELIEAHLEGVAALPGCFGAWGPVALDRPDPGDVDRLLARGCVGISVPAGALAGRERLEELGPLLARVRARGVPLFVHPGPAPGQRCAEPAIGEPLWWRALTDYVAQMQAAWLTFAAFGRREHPDLVILFAMLAGGAPLHAERLRARGGPPTELRDPLTFYDSSSYGPAALEAMSRHVGPAQLVYGSDRPVIEPCATGWERPLQSAAAALWVTDRQSGETLRTGVAA